ncbi:hypothetical protein TRICI_000765 [Trichomonascus ciferrii]|uniref:Zn(2)-C6 fungal-type domain-containing protein n=1 Tax=Trichomonascus ciferrii TaxID=44093 RepID=A0A642VBA2_9ASCO|nr:hypothetical protein TRICI_000765 [Trichomonascus ciferrii]
MSGGNDRDKGNEGQGKRPRVSRACEGCRTRKIKCDGEKPGCGNCRAHDLECVYTESIRKIKARKTGSTAGLNELEERLERLEGLLDSINSRLSLNGSVSYRFDAEKSASPASSLGRHSVEEPNNYGNKASPSFATQTQGPFSEQSTGNDTNSNNKHGDISSQSSVQRTQEGWGPSLHNQAIDSENSISAASAQRTQGVWGHAPNNQAIDSENSVSTASAQRTQGVWGHAPNNQAVDSENTSSAQRTQGGWRSSPNNGTIESDTNISGFSEQTAFGDRANGEPTELYYIGQASNYPSNGVLSNACLKWIANATGDEMLAERMGQVVKEINENNLSRVQSYLLQQTTTPDLPSSALMDYAWKLLDSNTGVWDFIISLDELKTVIKSSRGELPRRNGYGDWLFLFSACTAALFIGSKHNLQTGEGDRKWSDEDMRKLKANCCSGAIYYLNRSFLIPPTPTTLRALVLLIIGLGCINFYPNSALTTLAARMALDLGLQRQETYQDKSTEEAENLKRLFWVVYSTDRETAVLNCRMPAIMDFDVSVEYPTMHPLHREIGLDADAKAAQLWRIYGDVFEFLYSARASKSTPVELVHHVFRLDKDLKAWRDSVEAKFRPGGDFTHRSSANIDAIPPRSWYTYWDVLHLHLGYFHLLSLIHQVTAFHPEYVRQALDNNHQENARDYSHLYASLDICVSSARSTVKTLQMTANFDSRLLGPSLLYCADAFTTLFLECLARPKELSTLHDLEQMSALLNLFEIDADSNSAYQARDDPGRRAVIKFWTILYQAAETHVQKHQPTNPQTTTETPQAFLSPIPSTYQPSSPNLPFDDFFQFTDSTTAQSLYQLPSHLYSWDSEIASLLGNI